MGRREQTDDKDGEERRGVGRKVERMWGRGIVGALTPGGARHLGARTPGQSLHLGEGGLYPGGGEYNLILLCGVTDLMIQKTTLVPPLDNIEDQKKKTRKKGKRVES